jgi:hypothetical protein
MGGRTYETASPGVRKRIENTIAKLKAFGYTVRRTAPDDYLAFRPRSPKPGKPAARPTGKPCGGAGREPCVKLKCVQPPRAFRLGERRNVRVQITNLGTATIVAAGQIAVHLQPHWKSTDGKTALKDIPGTPLPYYLKPGDTAVVDAMVQSPSKPGEYLLEFYLARKRTKGVTPRASEKAVVRVRVR